MLTILFNRLPYIGIDLSTMLSADFAAAAVLIRYVDGVDGDEHENDDLILFHLSRTYTYSFGVVLGVASPLQLLVMTVGTKNDTLIIIIITSILLLKYEGA